MRGLVLLLLICMLVGSGDLASAASTCTPAVSIETVTSTPAGASPREIAAHVTATGPAENLLHSLTVRRITNASVQVDGRPVGAPTTIPFAPAVRSARLTMGRLAPEQPMLVDFLVRDRCGEMPKFLGVGGSAASPHPPDPATPTPTSTAPPAATPTATSTAPPAATPTATVPPTATPTATSTVPPTATPTATAPVPPAPEPLAWGMIGNRLDTTDQLIAAGITTKVVRFSWKDLLPAEHAPNTAYIQQKRAELAGLRGAGLRLIADLGLHDVPAWVHQAYPDSYYVDQDGNPYLGAEPIDNGDANLMFNPTLRAVAAEYVARVFAEFGADFYAIRLGAGRYGELTFPPARTAGRANRYWAFDRQALGRSPVPGWRPGQPSPNDEARRFYTWLSDSLVEFELWQIQLVRAHYGGRLMMLYPGWGVRPTQVDEAVARNLDGTSSAEINGEIQRALDYARLVGAISDARVVVTTTWLDADPSRDGGTDPRYWSPVRYLAALAGAHPLRLEIYGENTGQGNLAALDRSIGQMRAYGLLGMAWYREEEILSGQYISFDDLGARIRAAEASRRGAGF